MLGALIGAAGSYLGAKQQGAVTKSQQKRQIAQLNKAASGLEQGYQSVLNQIMSDPTGYAGGRVQAAMYENVNLTDSLRNTVGANQANLDAINNLVGQTNRATLQNDFSRANAFSPDILNSLQSLAGNAAMLSSGQLPQDAISQLISSRSSQAGASGIPGGSSPATLKDLGLSSLDAMNQGASLFQQVLQGAESISPISRQMSSAQFQFDPNTGLQTDLSQALLQQQSQQNYFNLAAAPDPAKQMQAQLQIQMANNAASTRAGIAGLQQSPVMPYAQIYGQIGTALGNGLGSLFGGGGGGGGGFSSGFGSFNGGAYNSYAMNYNQNTSAPPKAYVTY